jgi:hypothetical protein
MSGAWIAGNVRARGLAAADLSDVADRVARSAGLQTACSVLGPTKWGHHLDEVATVEAAQRKIFETLLWQLRILAGWLPSDGVEAIRSCVMWFEIRNVEDRLAYFAGARAEPPYQLGRLGIISRRLGGTGNAGDVRHLMRMSAWGDPRGDDVYAIRIWMRRTWYRRARVAAPELRPWADAAASLFANRERLAQRSGGRTVVPITPLLPPAWSWATAVRSSGQDLWHAEERWWAQVREEGLRMLHSSIGTQGPAVGAVAMLASSAHRIATALEIAAGGGAESLDATG